MFISLTLIIRIMPELQVFALFSYHLLLIEFEAVSLRTNLKQDLNMNELTGADFKSATADDNKKLFIETYGCQMNVADSEVIASVMQMAGYSVAETLEEADAVFMNTCSIRDNAEQKILNRLEFFHSLKKKKKALIVGVLGCMAERVKDDLITNHHVDLVVGPDAYLTLPEPDCRGRGRRESDQRRPFDDRDLP